MIPLVPTKRKLDSKIPKFAVCDIESLRWIEMLVIGFYGKLQTDDGKIVFEDEQYFENMFEFCDYCFESRQPFDQIFAHFGGKFDFQFIMKDFYSMRDKYHMDGMIPRGSGLLCFTVSTFDVHDKMPEEIKEKDFLGKTASGKFKIRKRSIKFKDSSAILPFGLGTLTKNFGVEHTKGHIDFDALNAKYKGFNINQARTMMKGCEDWNVMMKYLSHDLKGLFEVLHQYFNQPMIAQAGPAYTTASQAMKVYQNFLEQKISSLSSDDDEFCRDGYFGGRTEIFKPFFQASEKHKTLITYDVNSLYPYIMKTLEFPVRVDQREVTKINFSRMGIYDVTVGVPACYIPPLGVFYRNGNYNRYIFPVGEFRGKWTSLELEHAVSVGCKIMKVHNGTTFKSGGKIFEHYIETLYNLRKKAAKGSVDDITYKLLMNSLYGRFGLNINREQLIFDDGVSPGIPHMSLSDPSGEELVRILKLPKTLENSFVNVAIAAWVTSGARVHMHKQYMQAEHQIYYTDTDSLMTTHKFSSNEKELGALKKEMESTRACFLLPKTYMMETVEGISKTVMKGFDRKKIAHFKLEDFEASLEGETRRLRTTNPEKFATFKTALNKGQFLAMIKESNREIRSKYDKRRLFKVAGEWDSEPLNIRHDIIYNKPCTKAMTKLEKFEREYFYDNPSVKEIVRSL